LQDLSAASAMIRNASPFLLSRVVILENAFQDPTTRGGDRAHLLLPPSGPCGGGWLRTSPPGAPRRSSPSRFTKPAIIRPSSMRPFSFVLDKVSRQLIWSFAAQPSFLQSEQVSQRYVEMKPENFTTPGLQEGISTLHPGRPGADGYLS